MVATDDPMVEQALVLARRLSPRGRAELIGLIETSVMQLYAAGYDQMMYTLDANIDSPFSSTH